MAEKDKTDWHCNADKMCRFLAERAHVATGAGRAGFRAHWYLNLKAKTNDRNKTFLYEVSYHRNASDGGLGINCCPFCLGKPGRRLHEDAPAEAANG